MRRFWKTAIMQRLSPLQNSLGQSLKFEKRCEKRIFNHITGFLCKKRLRKHQIFEKWDDFEKRPSCKGYSLWKIVSLGQKLKLKKNMPKTILQSYYSCSVQRTAWENTRYKRNETILKNGHHAKAIAFGK